jgi:hypothetical protein
MIQTVGLEKSLSRNKIIRSGAIVAAQVTNLQDKLERSELQGEAMREERLCSRRSLKMPKPPKLNEMKSRICWLGG